MTATNHDSHNHGGHKVYHEGHSNENVKANGILLRNCQIHDIIGQISPSYVWSSWFMAVIVEPGLGNFAIVDLRYSGLEPWQMYPGKNKIHTDVAVLAGELVAVGAAPLQADERLTVDDDEEAVNELRPISLMKLSI